MGSTVNTLLIVGGGLLAVGFIAYKAWEASTNRWMNTPEGAAKIDAFSKEFGRQLREAKYAAYYSRKRYY